MVRTFEASPLLFCLFSLTFFGNHRERESDREQFLIVSSWEFPLVVGQTLLKISILANKSSVEVVKFSRNTLVFEINVRESNKNQHLEKVSGKN